MEKNYWIAGLIILAAVFFGGYVSYQSYKTTSLTVPGALNGFAQCLKDKGVIFYGAFWCPHCQRTKALFGASAKLLPYVECSNPDGQTQTKICIDKGIKQYPTWVFPDGSELTGERTLQELADKSACPLAAGSQTATSTGNTATTTSSPAK